MKSVFQENNKCATSILSVSKCKEIKEDITLTIIIFKKVSMHALFDVEKLETLVGTAGNTQVSF